MTAASSVPTGVCCKTQGMDLVESWSNQRGGGLLLPCPSAPLSPSGAQRQAGQVEGTGVTHPQQDAPGRGKIVSNFSETFPGKTHRVLAKL